MPSKLDPSESSGPGKAPLPKIPPAISRKKVSRIIIERIELNTPFSLIRFGEGEGRVLGARGDDVLSIKLALRKIKKQTGQWLGKADVLLLRNHLLEALIGADILGLGSPESWGEGYKSWYNVIVKSYMDCATKALADRQLLTHPFVNYDIADELESIVNKVDKTTIVSCRDLSSLSLFESVRGHVNFIQIPSQFTKRYCDSDYEKNMHNTQMWPNVYEKLIESARGCSKGELFLVGAGLFAKYICSEVKNRGGFSIDMGSALDSMVGLKTRG